MKRNLCLLLVLALFANSGCTPPATDVPAKSDGQKGVVQTRPSGDTPLRTDPTDNNSEQAKSELLKQLKEQMAAMEAEIEKLKLKGAGLASESKTQWDLRMSELETKRKAAYAKLLEIENSSSQAWSDMVKGAQAAWEELKRAFETAKSEF